MDVTKGFFQNLRVWLVFLFLAIFPLGQLLRLDLGKISIQAIDVIACMSILFFDKKSKISRQTLGLVFVLLFSTLLSLSYFPANEVFIGSLYLLRFLGYTCFFFLVWSLVRQKRLERQVLFKSLILVSSVSAIFGWIQYFFLPDLTFLKTLGWDDHAYRLVGTFLDPGFTGIILVLAFLLTLTLVVEKKEKGYIALALFLLVSVAFTYSRASYLALLVGIGLLLFQQKAKFLYLAFFFFLLILPLLPRPSSEGVKLERTYSITARLENHIQTFKIFKRYPLFGVGFNNICSARKDMFSDSFKSHSCKGADSSFLFISVTTGIVGFLVFLNTSLMVLKNVARNFYGRAFLLTLVALFINSLFINSLFYPWVMGYMGILLAISIKE